MNLIIIALIVSEELSFMDIQYNLNGSPKLTNLIDENGLSYNDFKKSLKINYKIIIFDIFFIILMIISGFYFFENLKYTSSILYFVCHFLWNSFWFASYFNFFHESAHYNLHHNKKLNDFLSIFLFSLLNGQDIKNLRITHWQHHKHLGTIHDTENSYSEPLSFKEILKVLFFVYVLKKIFKRNTYLNKSEKKFISKFFFISLSVHFMILISLILTFDYLTASVWIYTFLAGIPLFFKIRQTLEHRNIEHSKNEYFNDYDHGPTNRLFQSNFFSRFFGSAGFNKHLLHHWDPAISYTNFKEFEKYLLKTNLKEQVLNCKSNYKNTFVNLINI